MFEPSNTRAIIRREWTIPVAFALLVIGSVIYAAAHPWFWQRAHDVAPIAGLLVLVLVALLLLRWRFAWWVFAVMSVGGEITWIAAAAEGHFGVHWLIEGLLGLLELALILSPPTGRFVWRHPAPSGQTTLVARGS